MSVATPTVPVSEVLPDFDQYEGPPLDFGRMEATASDPSVPQQFGMVVGIPKAGQLSAFSTLNIRGERSVTCKAACDMHPGQGPIPGGCPAACEQFRRQPDALERAAELDAQYGRTPDLATLPMYCIPMDGLLLPDPHPVDTRRLADHLAGAGPEGMKAWRNDEVMAVDVRAPWRLWPIHQFILYWCI